MSTTEQADAAQARLVDAARAFSKLTPRKNPSGAYGRALAELLACRDDFARKTDEEWAQEIAELRALLDTAYFAALGAADERNPPFDDDERRRIETAIDLPPIGQARSP